jgi:hypothetical protein
MLLNEMVEKSRPLDLRVKKMTARVMVVTNANLDLGMTRSTTGKILWLEGVVPQRRARWLTILFFILTLRTVFFLHSLCR